MKVVGASLVHAYISAAATNGSDLGIATLIDCLCYRVWVQPLTHCKAA